MRNLSLWFVAFACTTHLTAQSIGSLTGLLPDSQGSVIIGPQVTAENFPTGPRPPPKGK